MLDIHPWADQVKYARTGGEMMSMAVRIAQEAENQKFFVLYGWYDWYLSSNLSKTDSLKDHLLGLEPIGVPYEMTGSVIPFKFNN